MLLLIVAGCFCFCCSCCCDWLLSSSVFLCCRLLVAGYGCFCCWLRTVRLWLLLLLSRSLPVATVFRYCCRLLLPATTIAVVSCRCYFSCFAVDVVAITVANALTVYKCWCICDLRSIFCYFYWLGSCVLWSVVLLLLWLRFLSSLWLCRSCFVRTMSGSCCRCCCCC